MKLLVDIFCDYRALENRHAGEIGWMTDRWLGKIGHGYARLAANSKNLSRKKNMSGWNV